MNTGIAKSDGPPAAADAEAGVTALYEAHAPGPVGLAIIMLGDRHAAEDVVQDAFFGLYRNWERLCDPSKALTYVRSSVLNGCRTAIRQPTRRDRASVTDTRVPPGRRHSRQQPGRGSAAHERFRRAGAVQLQPALPGRHRHHGQREVVCLRRKWRRKRQAAQAVLPQAADVEHRRVHRVLAHRREAAR